MSKDIHDMKTILTRLFTVVMLPLGKLPLGNFACFYGTNE